MRLAPPLAAEFRIVADEVQASEEAARISICRISEKETTVLNMSFFFLIALQ